MKTTCFGLNGLFCLLCIVLKTEAHASAYNFSLICPPNVTISCTEDISNLDKWGKAYVLDNYVKKPAPAPVKTIYNTNACGIGTITRTWQVEDPHWQILSCSQEITVSGGSQLFSYSDIVWPQAYTIESCNPNVDPRYLPAAYSYPTFKSVRCSQPMWSYRDSKFTVSPGCMKVLREWKVIDWCQYKPNVYPSVGVWTYTQILKLIVNDSTAKLVCPRDTAIQSGMDCKGAFVKLDTAFAVSKCGYTLSIRNTSPYAKSTGADASGNYPIGTTEFYYIAEYGCGKELKCKVRVTVRNAISPVPYCLNGLIVALMPVDTNRDGTPDDGMIQVWAKDLNIGSYHPCGYKQLRFSFSSDTTDMFRVFTCADLGKNEVQMWVTDSLGNQTFCKTYVEVQNNNARIPDCKRKDSVKTTIVIAGSITDTKGNPCNEVHLDLTGNAITTIVKRTDTVLSFRFDTIIAPSGLVMYVRHTDTSLVQHADTSFTQWHASQNSTASGTFLFKDFELGKDYHLSLDRRETDMKGININDVIVLLKHIMGTEKITDPYVLIAADIDSNSKIDQADFDLLYALVAGTKSYTELPRHWRFVRKPFLFSNPLNPFADPFEQTANFSAIRTSYTNFNYTAIRVGELDGFTGGFTTLDMEDRQASSTSFADSSFSLENVFPNPVTESRVYFKIHVRQQSTIHLSMYGQNGNHINTYSRSFDKGSHIMEFEFPANMYSGLALYRITDGTSSFSGKVFLNK